MARHVYRCLMGECRKALVTFDAQYVLDEHQKILHDVEMEVVDIDAINEDSWMRYA